MIDLEAIKARSLVAARQRQGAEATLNAYRSADDVPAMVAEVERLRGAILAIADLLEEMSNCVDFQAENQAVQEAEDDLRCRAAEAVASARSIGGA